MSEFLESVDPSTGAVIGRMPITPTDAIPAIVARAQAAQPAWAELSFEARGAKLAAAVDALLAEADELGTLIAREMGKPVREGIGEVRAALAGVRDTLREIEAALAPEVQETAHTRSTLFRDPYGVAACIAPWNFPLLTAHDQVLPALAAGNAVVFKPSENTPLVGEAYARRLLEHLPEGVFQIVHGAGPVGRALVQSDVDLVVFTGSRETGRSILEEASRSFKRVILELGGKDPMIVLDDADLDAAARFAARSSFRNAGQVCVSTERIFVTNDHHDVFVRKLVEEAEKFRVGPSLEDGVRMGPMVHAQQKAKVEAQVARALEMGAKLEYKSPVTEGNFLGPIVLSNVTHDMEIAREETFGPVACVMRVADEDEAVRAANDTRFGLGAVVFGEPEHARRVARRLTAGMVGINQSVTSAIGTPWVGARESGYGFHSGREGHRQFTQLRVIHEPI